MATNLGTLIATVGVDTRPLKKGLKDAEHQTKASTGRMLAHWKSMAVGIVATYALYKTARLVKETALLAARFETLDIVMQTVGKNAGYSAGQMEQYDLALRKIGISMIESRNSLARMAMAQLDLNKATQLGRIAQDAAVIGNINSSEAFQRMIYGIQTGNLIVLRRIGINVSFEESYKRIAKATGRTTASFTEAEKAMIRQNAVIAYGSRIAGTYEAAMTTAGKKLTSFVRYVEDFKVKMGIAFGPATVTLVDAATQAMKDMQEQISRPEAQEALRELSSQLAEIVVQLGRDLPKAIETITKGVRILSSAVDSLSFSLSTMSKLWNVFAPDETKKRDWNWWEGMTGPEFHKISESMDKFLSQYEKMQEMLAGTPIRLDFALEDPDKYFGEMKAELLAWEKEGFKSIKEWYKSIETLAQEKMESISELEDEETRMLRENLAYRLIVQKKYYEEIETAAQEARDFEEKMEDEQLRMARETADYRKKLAIERLAMTEKMYSDLKFTSDDYYAYQLNQLQRQSDDYEKFTGNTVLAHLWLTEQIKALDEERLEAADKSNQHLIDLSQRTADAMEDNFSSFYRDFFRGELDSAEDYFRKFCYSLTDSFSDMMGQMTKEMIFGGGSSGSSGLFKSLLSTGISSWFGGGAGGMGTGKGAMETGGAADWSSSGAWSYDVLHKGGTVGVDAAPTRMMPSSLFAHAPRLHEGYSGLKSDEFPAILKYNETVLPPGVKPVNKTQNTQNTMISVPVTVDADRRLSARLQAEIENTVKNVMREEMR